MERRPALHPHRLAWVMGDDEHVVVVWRVVSPPTVPLLISPGSAARGPEHVAAHDRGADIRACLVDDLRAWVHLAALLLMRLAPSGQWDHPVVQSFAALPERGLVALIRPRDKSV